jgi:internalin A
MAPLRRLEKIEVWTDKAIQAGEEWDVEIENNLRDSNIILLLVSADFVASSYIWEKEIPMALQLEKESGAKVVPIYLRPFDFSGLNFSKNQMIPKDSGQNLRAISQWENMDEAYMEVARKIREVIESFN